MTATTVLDAQPAAPPEIHNCPNCSHWLPEGTLACPDCQTLTYGNFLSELDGSAQQLEQQGRWQEARDRWRSTLQWLPENTQQAASIQQHIAGIDGRLQRETDQRERWTKRLGPFAPIVLFLAKAKSALFLLFKVKFLFGLLAFFGVYWALFGIKFALGFTASIFIHEMGHFVAVKRRGLRAGCFGIYLGTHNTLFLVLANVGAWLNVFNMMPLTLFGLDGAQATYALSGLQRALIAATAVVFFALTFSNGNPQWVLLFVGLMMGWRAFGRDTPEQQHTGVFAYFLGLLVVLGVLLYRTSSLAAAILPSQR